MKILLYVVVLLVVLGVAIWRFGPREPVVTAVSFDESLLGSDLDAYLSTLESRYDDITPGTEKQLLWAGDPGQKTDWAIVYVHGFSATSAEIRPVPDDVAKQLGANLFLTRLAGHGRNGAALAEVSVEHWMEDIAEALTVARQIGEKTLIIATSTGATLTSLALQEDMGSDMGSDVAGVVLISPNFRIQSAAAALLTWPGARWWLPKLAGEERAFEASNPDHAKFWTNTYPSRALFPMAAAVKAARTMRHENTHQPALFMFDDLDRVINHTATRDIAAQWGGPVDLHVVDVGPQDDPNRHVIAGRILSPGQTVAVTEKIVSWVKGLE